MASIGVAKPTKPQGLHAMSGTPLSAKSYCDRCNGFGQMITGDHLAGGIMMQCQCGYTHEDSAFIPLLSFGLLISVIFAAYILASI